MNRSKLRWLIVFALLCCVAPVLADNPWAIPAGSKKYKDVAYVEGRAAPRQKMDVIVPPHEEGKKLPVVVWVHGGAWLGGDKANNPAVMFLSRGFVAVSVNYRLSQDAIWPAQITDCRAAVRYLRKNADQYDIDPDRIIAWGGSAGGHLVAMLGVSSDQTFADNESWKDIPCNVLGVIDWFGPTDLTLLDGEINGVKPVAKLIGGPVKANLDKTKSASPVNYVTAHAAPTLFMHGDHDPLVPLAQSQTLHDLLENSNVRTQMITLKDAGHGGPAFFAPETLKQVFDFVDDLKKAEK